ncbi:hypothetical protein [Planctomicrobium sp. SH664]|uniref:hypothetical protein n=1 Tax=Planctomicrobium sp. SH664 TaxID=3448125 RepID=UPI003F5BC80C
MQSFHAYRRNASAGWTRIEMLLAIYDATIAGLEAGIDEGGRGGQAELLQQRFRVTKLLLLLLDGIDVGSGEVAQRIHDLCVFCIEQVNSPGLTGWENALSILQTLRAGFEGIREEANQLEASGQVSSVGSADRRTVLHV